MKRPVILVSLMATIFSCDILYRYSMQSTLQVIILMVPHTLIM